MNEGVVSKETVVLRRWGSSIQKFGFINGVDKSKGLNFVPITKRTNEFSIKQDVEKFLRRIPLKAFFHDKEDYSDTSNKDIFETLLVRKSKWTPPEGQFASLDFFTNLNLIATLNFPTFRRKSGRRLKILVNATT